MWELIGRVILEHAADMLADVFCMAPLYPEEWGIMRWINAFLAVCTAAFFMAAGLLGWPLFWIAAGLLLASCITRLLVRKMME